MDKLFYIDESITKNTNKSKVNDIKADYYIDTSGSTSGSILKYQLKSANKFIQYIDSNIIIDWNSYGKIVDNLSQIVRSSGGTVPSAFVQYVNNPDCIIIYTDGGIDKNEMDKFHNLIKDKVNDIPIIIVLTLCNAEILISQLNNYINMSIPEIFLSLSNNVLILINDINEEKILMTKGCFDILPSKKLIDITSIYELPIFNLDMLVNVIIPDRLPNHLIKLKDFEYPLDLNEFYNVYEYDIPIEILQSLITNLSDRIHFSRLDLNKIHTVLVNIQRKIVYNQDLEDIRNDLYQIAISNESGSLKHQQLIEKYNTIKSNNRNNLSKNKVLIDLINNFLNLISDYNKDNTLFVYGSNRANRAVTYDENDLTVLEDCPVIDCPILMIEDDACILIKYPSIDNYVENYTSDYAMESPFELGTWLVDLLTVGVFSHEIMACNIQSHPITRDRILGFLPLSWNPKIVMKHMSKLFGNRKVLWHFVRAYISMLTYLCDYQWANKSLIVEVLQKLCLNYKVSSDLKASDDKTSLTQALSHVYYNYSTCLRDRTYTDVTAILKIINLLYPEIVNQQIEKKIYAMIRFIKDFIELLDLHKKHVNMISYVMDVDEYDHYVNKKSGVKALLAYMLWYDVNGTYRGYKLQTAINYALNHSKFGIQLNNAFNGEEYDESVIDIAYPEPTGLHFEEESYFQWEDYGFTDHHCIYCGLQFENLVDKKVHLKEALGNHFYNGHLATKLAIKEHGKEKSDHFLFLDIKNRLYKMYTDKAKFLHTKRCKLRILYFIKLFKENGHK